MPGCLTVSRSNWHYRNPLSREVAQLFKHKENRSELQKKFLSLRQVLKRTIRKTLQGLRDKVWPLLAAGTIKPIIYKTFPLKEAAAAHAELERADHVGKVMLTV